MPLPHIFLSVAGIGLGVMCFVGLFLYNNTQMHEPHTQRSTWEDSSSYRNNNGSSNVKRRGHRKDKCPICLEDCISNYKILQCSHQFHADCIQTWMRQSTKCPTCRATIQ